MKSIILQKLRKSNPGYVSGEALSDMLGVSRTAVWKYINELKKEGYIIESSSRKGYKLIPDTDIVNGDEISYNLNTKVLGKKIYFFNEIDSTNTFLKKEAGEGCDEGAIVVADSQTAGKGRLGRVWSSSGGKGIWMSVLLRPKIVPEEVQTITLAASVAVVKAVRNATGIDAGIKWPNDIILEGKKVCGILTEMSSEMERVNFLVLGIGLNVNHDTGDFPDILRDTATSLKIYAGKSKPWNRSGIIGEILYELETVYDKIKYGRISEIIEEWRKYSVTLGKEVMITDRNGSYTAHASDITSDGRLVVNCKDGTVREIVSGEISVRGLLGYV